MTNAPGGAGWHPDPAGRHGSRFFDGEAWTEHVTGGAVPGTDPLFAPPPLATVSQDMANDASAPASALATATAKLDTGWPSDKHPQPSDDADGPTHSTVPEHLNGGADEDARPASGFSITCKGQAVRAWSAIPAVYRAVRIEPKEARKQDSLSSRAGMGCLGFLVFGFFWFLIPLLITIAVVGAVAAYAMIFTALWGVGAAIDAVGSGRGKQRLIEPGADPRSEAPQSVQAGASQVSEKAEAQEQQASTVAAESVAKARVESKERAPRAERVARIRAARKEPNLHTRALMLREVGATRRIEVDKVGSSLNRVDLR
ncbi:MAG: DUF2510 domain-containing protein [Actinomycetota bacterium]|nr:DUF2510 domain-containing protein [Actinomycetota bacterium]